VCDRSASVGSVCLESRTPPARCGAWMLVSPTPPARYSPRHLLMLSTVPTPHPELNVENVDSCAVNAAQQNP